MPCPICSSKKTQFFAKKDEYIFHRCKMCKTIFLTTLPSQKQLNRYYAKQFSYSDGLLNEAVIRKRSHIILKKIKYLAPQAKTLCDVGSGYGFFLDEAHNTGFKVAGIEPSHQLANHAKRNYRIPTFIGELKKYIDEEQRQFDMVTCIHVIEHVASPKEFVSLLFQLVKPGGLLYLETPNSDSHLLYAEREQYTFLIPPNHLWLFSKESLKHLLPKNTEIICINTYSYSEHFMGITKRIIKNLRHSEHSEESRPIGCKIRFARSFDGAYTELAECAQDDNAIKKKLSYFLFDRLLAPLFTGTLNLYYKGSILELYIRKKAGKSGL